MPKTVNRLLAALPENEYARIAAHLSAAPLHARQVIQKRDEPLTHVYFPGRTLCSLVINMEDGASAEIAVVGSEGIVGAEAAFGLRVASCDAVVQATGDGEALAMSVDAFRAELARHGALEFLARRYNQAFTGFVMQSVACNALHSVHARCCRWFLHAQDRLESSDLPLTQDALSTMLGVRRPTVTMVISDLTQLGILATSRKMIRIVDRAGLESHACVCYVRVKELFDTLLSAELASRRQNGPAPDGFSSFSAQPSS
jgi:CRP-like cAMP-binding protein